MPSTLGELIKRRKNSEKQVRMNECENVFSVIVRIVMRKFCYHITDKLRRLSVAANRNLCSFNKQNCEHLKLLTRKAVTKCASFQYNISIRNNNCYGPLVYDLILASIMMKNNRIRCDKLSPKDMRLSGLF